MTAHAHDHGRESVRGHENGNARKVCDEVDRILVERQDVSHATQQAEVDRCAETEMFQ